MSFGRKPTARKKPRAPPPKFTPAYSIRNSAFDNADEDSLGHALTADEIRLHEEQQNRRAFTYLSADAVRWIQKHKPSASSSAKNFIPPSRVLQLRAIFRGLDFDGSGEIDLKELKDAVRFVSQQDTGSAPPVFENPEQLVKIFEDMDIDKNGNVDFDEFLIGMTSEVAGKQTGNVSGARMQGAFFDFANKHRRQTITDKIVDESLSTQERYNELRKLYNMRYLKDEPMDCTVDEMIAKMKREAMQQKKEMNKVAEKFRRAEINRARAAHLYFEEEQPDKGHVNYSDGEIKRKSKNLLADALHHLTGQPEDDERIQARAQRRVRNSLSMFSLSIADTFTPALTTTTSTSAIERKMHDLAYTVKKAPVYADDLLLPPANVEKNIMQRVETARDLHYAATSVEQKSTEKKITSGLALANSRRAERGASLYGNKTVSILDKRRADTNSTGSASSASIL